MPDIAIIVLNWNSYDDTHICLESLRKTTYCGFITVVVDNGSQDGSIKRLMEEFPECVYICNPFNAGFAGGNNVGIRWALEQDVKYIMLLNNDTEVTPGFLEPLVQFMDVNPCTAVVQSLLLNIIHRDIVDSMGGIIFSSGITADLYMGRKIPSLPKITEIFYACGASSLFRSIALREVGLLDESYFCIYEDVDIAWRLHLKGYQAFLISDSAVFHKRGISASSTISTTREFYFRRNGLSNIIRYLPLSSIVKYSPIHMVSFIKCISLSKSKNGGWLKLLSDLWQSVKVRHTNFINKHAMRNIHRLWLIREQGCWDIFTKKLCQ